MKGISVSAAIILKDNKVLATQKGYGEFKGMWEFPGGKLEEGESPESALIREIREELDTEINIVELLDTVEYTYPNFKLKMYCYIVALEKESFILNEALSARWLTGEQLFDVEWLPADLAVIEKLKKYMS